MAEWAATFGASLIEANEMSATFNDDEELSAQFGDVQKVSTNNYEFLYNKPKIEGNELIGDKTFIELGLNEITPQEIDEMIYGG